MREKARKKGSARRWSGSRISRETGTIIKDWGGRLPVSLIYPNSYYLGMSNLGVHGIYRFLNSYHDVVCERAFLEKGLLTPASVESQRPLADFAILAFSISYELDYFNVVSVLKAAGIPVFTADRDERHPLVIAGGPCVTANPAPISPFFDCLCIGEAEAILPEMLPVLAGGISGKREELLRALSVLPGIYVPALPPSAPVARRWAKDLDAFATTSVVLTPDTELGELYLIEVERGCNWRCRFCMVSTHFAPARFRSVRNIIEQAGYGLRYRKRIGLVGPAVASHPQIYEILSRLRQMGAGLAVSSLRINSLYRDILELLAKGNSRTITIAPEAGTHRLRRLLNKNISDDDFLEAVDEIAARRIKNLKLYFIIGLPSETDEDMDGIIRLVLAGKERIDRRRSGTRITVNMAPFVPKAGTPFQWLPMAPLPTLNRRLTMLKKSLSPRGIRVQSESPAWSRVQGVLARGDSRVAAAIAGIGEVSLAGWRRAAEKYRLDIDHYIGEVWDTEQELPWSVIDSGRDRGQLKKEIEGIIR